MKEAQKLAEYVLGLTEDLHNLGLRMFRNRWKKSLKRKKVADYLYIEADEHHQKTTA